MLSLVNEEPSRLVVVSPEDDQGNGVIKNDLKEIKVSKDIDKNRNV